MHPSPFNDPFFQDPFFTQTPFHNLTQQGAFHNDPFTNMRRIHQHMEQQMNHMMGIHRSMMFQNNPFPSIDLLGYSNAQQHASLPQQQQQPPAYQPSGHPLTIEEVDSSTHHPVDYPASNEPTNMSIEEVTSDEEEDDQQQGNNQSQRDGRRGNHQHTYEHYRGNHRGSSNHRNNPSSSSTQPQQIQIHRQPQQPPIQYQSYSYSSSYLSSSANPDQPPQIKRSAVSYQNINGVSEMKRAYEDTAANVQRASVARGLNHNQQTYEGVIDRQNGRTQQYENLHNIDDREKEAFNRRWQNERNNVLNGTIPSIDAPTNPALRIQSSSNSPNIQRTSSSSRQMLPSGGNHGR